MKSSHISRSLLYQHLRLVWYIFSNEWTNSDPNDWSSHSDSLISFIVLFLFPDPTLQLVVMLPQVPLDYDSFSDLSQHWLVRNFIEYRSAGMYLMLFSWLEWVVDFGEEKWQSATHRGKTALFKSYLGHRAYQCCSKHDHLAEVMSVRFLHWKVTIPCTILSSWEGSHYVQATHKEWELAPSLKRRVATYVQNSFAFPGF